MSKKRFPKRDNHPTLSGTRNAVETSIDLSKEWKKVTWEDKIERIGASIKHWAEVPTAQEVDLN